MNIFVHVQCFEDTWRCIIRKYDNKKWTGLSESYCKIAGGYFGHKELITTYFVMEAIVEFKKLGIDKNIEILGINNSKFNWNLITRNEDNNFIFDFIRENHILVKSTKEKNKEFNKKMCALIESEFSIDEIIEKIKRIKEIGQ